MKLGRHGTICNKCGQIIIDEYRCPNCFYKLILRSWKNQYKCQACKRIFPQKEIENNTFVSLNIQQRKKDISRVKKRFRDKRYIRKHHDKEKARYLRYYYTHIEERKAKNKEYYKTHKHVKYPYREYNKDKIRKNQREWSRKKDNKDRRNARSRERYKTDENYRKKVLLQNKQHRARKKLGVRKK